MVSLIFVFWVFVGLGAIIGTIRGWAKELLVTVSVVLAVFIINVLENFVTFLSSFYEQGGPASMFGTRVLIVLVLAFFGYQTPHLRFLARGAVREKLQDSILGFFLGGLNGYLIIGTIWYYLHIAGYPFDFVLAPQDPRVSIMMEAGSLETTMWFIEHLPPAMMTEPLLYFLVAGLFTLVVMVFI